LAVILGSGLHNRPLLPLNPEGVAAGRLYLSATGWNESGGGAGNRTQFQRLATWCSVFLEPFFRVGLPRPNHALGSLSNPFAPSR